jgi:hypothetical protein
MATTAKELIEILQKYTDPDEVVIWQYYTRDHFELDDLTITNKQFARVSDNVERWELWTTVFEEIQEETYKLLGKQLDDEV